MNEDLSRMGELEDQLKRTIVKTHRCRIQEKIRNLRQLIKKTKTELENVKDIKDRPDNECATHPYSKQIRQGEIRKAYALSRFYGYIQKCLKSWSDMYAQSKRMTEPVLPQYSSSSTTPIDCELVGENGCIWSKDVHDVSKSQSQICKIIRTSREMYSGLVAKSVIAHDQGSNKESSIPSSSPSITPCPEATSLAVLSVNDEVNESMNTAIQEEEEGEEEDNYEVDDDVLARECALLVESVMMMMNTCMCLKSVPIPQLPSLMAMAMAMAMLATTVSTTTTVLPLPSRTVFTTAVRTLSQLSPLLACLWRKTNPSTLLQTLPCLHSQCQ